MTSTNSRAYAPYVTLALFLIVPLVLMSAPLTHRYLYADETWFIRSTPHSFDTYGRPLIKYPFMLGIFMWNTWGLAAITLSRVIGTALLAVSGLLIYGYLRGFGYKRSVAAPFAIGVLTLPGFLILSASVFQIQVGTVAAFAAGFVLGPVIRQPSLTAGLISRLLLGALLGAIALCTYQLSMMLIFVMLLVPILGAQPGDWKTALRVVLVSALMFAVVAIYFIIWKSSFTVTYPAMDLQYAPDAASLSKLIEGLVKFPGERFTQVANLWYVQSTGRSPIYYVSTLIVVAALVSIIARERLFGLVKVLAAVAILPLSDVFRLAAAKSPTLVTMHSVDAAWWFLVALSIIHLFGRDADRALIAVVALGVVMGTWSTTVFALRNNAEFAAVHDTLVANPLARYVHVTRLPDRYPELRELGDTTGQQIGFLRTMTHSISIAIGMPLRALATSVPIEGIPWSAFGDYCGRPDILVRIPGPSHVCEGIGCRVPDEEIDKMTWPTCGGRI